MSARRATGVVSLYRTSAIGGKFRASRKGPTDCDPQSLDSPSLPPGLQTGLLVYLTWPVTSQETGQ